MFSVSLYVIYRYYHPLLGNKELLGRDRYGKGSLTAHLRTVRNVDRSPS